MRTVVVIPVEKKFQLSDQRDALEGNQDQTSAFNLHGLDESLQDCDASMFAYGSETLCDSSRPNANDRNFWSSSHTS